MEVVTGVSTLGEFTENRYGEEPATKENEPDGASAANITWAVVKFSISNMTSSPPDVLQLPETGAPAGKLSNCMPVKVELDSRENEYECDIGTIARATTATAQTATITTTKTRMRKFLVREVGGASFQGDVDSKGEFVGLGSVPYPIPEGGLWPIGFPATAMLPGLVLMAPAYLRVPLGTIVESSHVRPARARSTKFLVRRPTPFDGNPTKPVPLPAELEQPLRARFPGA